jgi:dolichyl-phosphate-mannose-protein mannosyltransferase
MSPAVPHVASSRSTALALALVVALGLGLRGWRGSVINESQPNDRTRLTADEPGYDNLARALLNGEGFVWAGRVPVYPLWLAGLHRLTHYSYACEIYIQGLVGGLAIVLTFVLGRDVGGNRVGLIAALGAAIDLSLIQQSVRFLSEVLFTPAVLAVTISFSRALDRPSRGRFAAVGFWIGLANLIRPTLLLFPLVAAAVTMRRTRPGVEGAVAILAVSSVVVLPWIVHNHRRYGAIYPLATSNAILWQGSPEYYHLVRDEGYTYLDVWNKVLYGPGSEGHDPGSIEGDRYWTRRALRSIGREPLVYLRFCAEKAVTYWVGDPNADWNDGRMFDYRALRAWEWPRSIVAQHMFWRAFPLVAFASLMLLRDRLGRYAALLALLAYCTALHALTHAEVRLSEPLHPLLLVITAAAIETVLWKTGDANSRAPSP